MGGKLKKTSVDNDLRLLDFSASKQSLNGKKRKYNHKEEHLEEETLQWNASKTDEAFNGFLEKKKKKKEKDSKKRGESPNHVYNIENGNDLTKLEAEDAGLSKEKKKKKRSGSEENRESNHSKANSNDKFMSDDIAIDGFLEKKKKKKKGGKDFMLKGMRDETEEGESMEKKNKKRSERDENRENHHYAANRRVDSAHAIHDDKVMRDVMALRRCIDVGETAQSNGYLSEEMCDDVVVVKGQNINQSKYKALRSFRDSNLPDELLQCCQGFTKPSPIQARAWPFLLEGRDLIGVAATGSGKTLGFGVPAIKHVLDKTKGKAPLKKANPRCLVLSPTRELAQQIFDVLCEAGKPCGVKSVCLYGGTSKGPQIRCLKSGVDIIIGTPGRLKDLLEMGICSLKEVSFVVLDEADRMLDMGFEPEVRSILSKTCSERQMLMFSATWPLPVDQLAQEFMDPNPVKVVVGSEDLTANHDVMQIVEVLDERSRDERLVALLGKYHKSKRNRVLVFVLYKKEATRVENMLYERGWKAVSIHGDKAQHARTEALMLFKDGTRPLMIATDVAARGLDIPDVEVVINYSFPLTTEDYVHRIGRTGRAGKKGIAHTFFTKENKGLAGELVNVLNEAGQVVPVALLNFGTHVKKKESKIYGAHFKEISADAPKATKITFNNSDDED